MAIEAEVSAALAGVRRRARYLREANRRWDATEIPGLVVSAGIGLSMMWRSDWEFSEGTVGFVFVILAFAFWRHRRLQARVDALTKLVSEIGYPEQA